MKKETKMDKDQIISFGAGLLVGAVIGGVVALLYAPQTGKETRQQIKDKTTEVVGAVKDKTTGVVDAVKGKTTEVVGAVKDKTAEVVDAVKEKTTGAVHAIRS
jgi:gas vesicle protein